MVTAEPFLSQNNQLNKPKLITFVNKTNPSTWPPSLARSANGPKGDGSEQLVITGTVYEPDALLIHHRV